MPINQVDTAKYLLLPMSALRTRIDSMIGLGKRVLVDSMMQFATTRKTSRQHQFSSFQSRLLGCAMILAVAGKILEIG